MGTIAHVRLFCNFSRACARSDNRSPTNHFLRPETGTKGRRRTNQSATQFGDIIRYTLHLLPSGGPLSGRLRSVLVARLHSGSSVLRWLLKVVFGLVCVGQFAPRTGRLHLTLAILLSIGLSWGPTSEEGAFCALRAVVLYGVR